MLDHRFLGKFHLTKKFLTNNHVNYKSKDKYGKLVVELKNLKKLNNF